MQLCEYKTHHFHLPNHNFTGHIHFLHTVKRLTKSRSTGYKNLLSAINWRMKDMNRMGRCHCHMELPIQPTTTHIFSADPRRAGSKVRAGMITTWNIHSSSGACIKNNWIIIIMDYYNSSIYIIINTPSYLVIGIKVTTDNCRT